MLGRRTDVGRLSSVVWGVTVYRCERMFWKQMKLVAKHGAGVAKLRFKYEVLLGLQCIPVIPVSAKQRQEDTPLEARLSCLPHPQRVHFYLGGVLAHTRTSARTEEVWSPPEQTEDPGGGPGPPLLLLCGQLLLPLTH